MNDGKQVIGVEVTKKTKNQNKFAFVRYNVRIKDEYTNSVYQDDDDNRQKKKKAMSIIKKVTFF